MKKGWLLFILLALLSAVLPPRFSGAASPKSLTLMIYMAGSDLESQGGAASADIQEMIASGCDFSRVNLVILAGGAERWQLGLNPEELSVLELGARGMRVIQRWPKANMGAPETLSSFLNYAEQAFPAQEYALVFWNHGGGPMEGVCYDELYDRDHLSLAELAIALSDSLFSLDRRLSWIGFDACMMASVETAHVCADYARFMIASQETEPAMGWNYAFLADMAGQPDGAAVGQSIVDAYMKAAPDNRSLTLSVTDLDRLGEIKLAMSNFFEKLRDRLNADTFSALSNHRRDTKGFGRTTTLSDYDLADLYHLSEQYADQAPEESAALQAAVESVVVYNSTHQENAHGLSVYSPYYNKNSFSERWLSAYRELDFPNTYLSWISRYTSFWLGDQLADWSNLSGQALPVEEDGVQTVEMTLTREQQEHFASAKLVILRDQGYEDGFFEVWEIADLQPVDGILRADYDYRGLFVLDEKGKIVSDLYPFTVLPDGQYSIVAELEKVSQYRSMVQHARGESTAEENETKFVNLICTLEEGSDTFEVRNVIATPDDPSELTTGKQYVTLEASDYPYIFFSANRYAYFLTRDEDDGRILPYTQWLSGSIPIQNRTMIDEDGEVISVSEWTRTYHEQTADAHSYLFFSEVDNSKPWSLRFLEGQYSSQPLYAQFIVTDTQGVESATELIPLYSPALADSQSFSRELYRDEDVAMTLEDIQVIHASSGSGLYFRFLIENNTDFDLSFLALDLSLNQTMIDYTTLLVPNAVEAHSIMHETFTLPAEDIPFLGDRLTRVGFTAALYLSGDISRFTVGTDPVELETSLDLSSLGLAMPGTGMLRAETSVGDLSVQLLDLKEKKDGSIGGILHFVPLGEMTSDLSFFLYDEDIFGDAIVNGCYLRDSLHASHAKLILPPGYDFYVPFTLNRFMQLELVGKTSETQASPFSSTDGFAYWDIEAVERLLLPLLVDGVVTKVEFNLSEAFPLSYVPAEETERDAVPLLQDAPVSLSLRDVRVSEEGHLQLLADARNDSDTKQCFRATDCMLDGQYAEAQYMSETYFHDNLSLSGWIVVTPEEGAHRMLIDFAPPSPDISLAAVSSISLTFEMALDPGAAIYSSQLDWQRSGEVLLTGNHDVSVSENWEIHPAAMLPPLDLGILLGGNPPVPEDQSSYACTLRTSLTKDQLDTIESGVVSLVIPCGVPDFPDACYCIANLTGLYLDGSDLAVDFCGVLAAADGNDCPFLQWIRREEDAWNFLASWLVLSQGEDTLLFAEHALLTLSEEDSSVTARQYEASDSFFSLHAPVTFSDYLEVYSIENLLSGTPQHYDLWPYLGTVEDTLSLSLESPAFIFRPATDFEDLWVVFSFTCSNGLQYAISHPFREYVH